MQSASIPRRAARAAGTLAILLAPVALVAARSAAANPPRWLSSIRSITASSSVVVTAPTGTLTFTAQQSTVTTFTVQNTGSAWAAFNIWPVCSGSGLTSSCSASGNTGINAGETVTFTVTIQGSATGGTGSLTLNVADASAPSTVIGSATRSVSVTPLASVSGAIDTLRIAGTQAGTTTFTVQNPGSAWRAFNVWPVCSGAGVTTSCSASGNTGIGAGQYSTFTVTLHGSGTPGAGTIELNVADAATPSVVVAHSVRPIVTSVPAAVATANPGTSWDRSQCFSISGGPGVAFECGDLRIARALPTARTFGEVRGMSLLYGSRFGAAMPILAANVTLPDSIITPTRVTAELRVGALGSAKTSRASGEWTAADFTSAAARRIALTYSAASDASGTYAYEIAVTFWNGSTAIGTYTSDQGTFVLVNRSTSPYGRGWWPSGIEQLIHLANGDKAWIGADGSTRHYAVAGTNLWRATALDRPDSLTYDGTHWIRWAEHRTQVQFDAVGQHVATVSRLGRTTTFFYGSVPFRLDSVSVPGLSTALYRFDYSQPWVMNVLSPAPAGGTPRTTRVESNIDGITRICDPDTVCTGYVYSFSGGERHLTSAFDRRGVEEDFYYSFSHILTGIVRDATGLAVGRGFGPVGEARGLMVAGGVASSTLASDQFTTSSGPRGVGDYVAAYLNRFGAPVRIGEAGYYYDAIEYGDARFPALPTAVIKQNGFTTTARYDARGNVDTVTAINPYGDLRNAITTYAWDGKWDEMTSVTLPSADGSTPGRQSTFEVDPLTGNVVVTHDANGTTRFHYLAGLVDSATNADGALTTFTYDGLGNEWTARDPLGRVTTQLGDALGRVTERTVPTSGAVGSVRLLDTRTIYNATELDSVTTTRQLVNGAPQGDSLKVTSIYDAGGNLLSLTEHPYSTLAVAYGRMSTDTGFVREVTRQFAYDALGRKTLESAGDMPVEYPQYDKAGNVLTGTKRTADVRLSYDALNRLVARHWLDGTLADTLAYDDIGTGQLRLADNAAARIRRTYYPNGQLATDSLWIVLPDSLATDAPHVFGRTSTYDLEGRRVTATVPSTFGGGSTVYLYDNAKTGALATVTSALGTGFRFHYDVMGRLDTLVRNVGSAGQVTEGRQYDLASQLTQRVLTGPTGVGFTEVLAHDAAGKVTHVSSDSVVYDGFGRTVVSSLNTVREQFSYDALNNVLTSYTNAGHGVVSTPTFSYEPGTGRLTRREVDTPAGPDTTWYDYSNAGDLGERVQRVAHPAIGWTGVGFTIQRGLTHAYSQGRLVETRTTYDTLDADGSLRWGPYRTMETYGYDALGRRVWVALIHGHECQTIEPTTGCENAVLRSSWDGDELLTEERFYPAVLPAWAEPAAPSFPRRYGRVIYTHGSAVDQPLEIASSGMTIVPVPSWRGVFTGGVCGTARCADSLVAFPQRTGSIYREITGAYASAPWNGSLLGGLHDGSGYLYQRNRYLDPATGRFTQEDPIGLAGGMNLYGFASGDPVNLSDPLGLFADDIYFNEYGREISRTVNDEPNQYFLRYRGQDYALDNPLTPGSTPYIIHTDSHSFDLQAKALSDLATPHSNPLIVGVLSLPNMPLDFKHGIPDRSLFNSGGGLMTHKDKLGNAAWGRYMHMNGFSLKGSLRGAGAQGATAGGEDPLDQAFIRRGFGTP